MCLHFRQLIDFRTKVIFSPFISGSMSGGCSPDIQEVISAPHSPVKDVPNPIFQSHQTQSLPRGTSNHFLINQGT